MFEIEYALEMKALVEKKLKDFGCYDAPSNEVYSAEELNGLCDLVKKDKISAVLYALMIGFANGVKWKNKDLNNFQLYS